MNIYIIILSFFVLISIFYQKRRLYNKTVWFFFFLILWLIPGLKDLSVGTDAYSYYMGFNQDSDDARMFSGIQFGWYLINIFFYNLTNYQTFQLFCYAVIVGGFMLYIKRYSEYPTLSIAFYIGFAFYLASFNIMRQYIALAIIFPFIHLKDHNKLKFIFIVLLASTIHASSIICLLFLLIDKIKLKSNFFNVTIILITFIIGYFLPHLINLSSLFAIANYVNEGFAGYLENFGGERNLLTGILQNIFLIYSLILLKKQSSFWVKCYFLFIILNNVFGSMGFGNRIFLFLQIQMILAIPYICQMTKGKSRFFYTLSSLCYAIITFYINLSSNSGEIIPYKMLP